MAGALREVYEIVVEGDHVTHRALYYPVKRPDGPIAILDVFVKKSTKGSALPAPVASRVRLRLQRLKEIEREEELSQATR
jgi:phage-related protein